MAHILIGCYRALTEAEAIVHGLVGFDHGAGHPLLFLDDAKAPNCQKNKGFKDVGNYSEWPKVGGAVIQAALWSRGLPGRT
jgi:hypothetical protein